MSQSLFFRLDWDTNWTPPSLEVMSRAALPTCNFFWRHEMEGRPSPPWGGRRKSLDGSADFVRPSHDLRYLVASGSSDVSTHVSGNVLTVRSHDIRGHTPSLKISIFCFVVIGNVSTFLRRVSSFTCSSDRALFVDGTWITPPKNLTGWFPSKGSFTPERISHILFLN